MEKAYMGLGGAEVKANFRKSDGWINGKTVTVPKVIKNNKPFINFLSCLQGAGSLKVKGVSVGTCALARGEKSLASGLKLFIKKTKLSDGGVRWTASDEK